ncbi:MAG: EAL domain-containing protein [Terracidiphilus sp.]
MRDVFALTKAEARKAYPIDIEVVVTYSDPVWGLLFVRDATGSTFIDAHGTSTVYAMGTRIRVRAVSGVNENGDAMVHPRIAVLGSGALPKADRKSIAELDSGADESNLVVTEGLLHPCEGDWNRVCYRIFDGKKLVWLFVNQPDSPAAQSLVGAKVRATGVVGRHIDDTNKRVAAQLFVNSLKEIEVEAPSLPNAFSASPMSIGDLRDSEADERFVGQVHARGTVTWESPGRFSIQDRSGMVFVATGKNAPVHVGDTVDAIGFPSHGEFGLELSDAMVRSAAVPSHAVAIAPIQLTAAAIVKHAFNGRRVRLKGRLTGQQANATEFVYDLEDGGQSFTAILPRSDATREMMSLPRDSVLELTGVAVLQHGTSVWPEQLLVLVDSPGAMALGGNGWLTLKRALAILGGMGLCVIAALVWVTLLRRTVHRQTAILRARLENELHMETKYRRLFERNLAAVFSWRPDGTIVDCNIAFARLLGFHSREETIGRSYWSFQVDPVHREELCGSLRDEALSNREASLRREDGVIVHVLKNITPVNTPEGVLYETTAIDVTQLRQNQAELQRAKDAAVFESLNDPLTGLPNRRLLMDKLSFVLARAKRDASMVALLYLDLDGFKLVNDSLGHPIGDALLVQVATCLRSWVRATDVLARLGSDEFIVILDRLEAKEDATLVAEHLLNSLSNPFRVEGHDLAIGASIGISIFPENASDAEELIQHADSAMYAAKREGKNRVMSFTLEIGSLVRERLSLENLLRGALARHEIFVEYQPEFELTNHRLVRFEALARWNNPTLGQIPPVKFIPIAEESGLISALGAYIMEQSCTEALRWQSLMPHPIQVAVNVSSIQFRRKGFVEEVITILEQTGLKPELLQIELTESVMLSGAHSTAATMNRLRALGIGLAIDDFGTGYSSLSYLPSLPFDALKIDRSFVMNLDKRPESESMIRTLVALAHNIGMRVIVEGVETREQLELITALGANEVQGYLLGRPTANPVETFLSPQPAVDFAAAVGKG